MKHPAVLGRTSEDHSVAVWTKSENKKKTHNFVALILEENLHIKVDHFGFDWNFTRHFFKDFCAISAQDIQPPPPLSRSTYPTTWHKQIQKQKIALLIITSSFQIDWWPELCIKLNFQIVHCSWNCIAFFHQHFQFRQSLFLNKFDGFCWLIFIGSNKHFANEQSTTENQFKALERRTDSLFWWFQGFVEDFRRHF